MKTKDYDQLIEDRFNKLTPERKDRARCYLMVRIEELLVEQGESCGKPKSLWRKLFKKEK